MIYFLLLSLEIFFLFLLSRSVSKTLSKFLPITVISLIFLPGVIIHELSHLFAATILFVSAGNMEFVPKRNGDSVKMGSIEIARTDPIRRAIIGFAPVFLGLMIALGVVYLFSSNFLFLQNQGPYVLAAVVLALIYALFAVANTMFSSRADMEGTVEILIAILIVAAAAYALGFRFPPAYLDKIFSKEFVEVIQKSAFFLLAPIALDIFLLGIIRAFRR